MKVPLEQLPYIQPSLDTLDSIPTQYGTLTYNEKSQTPQWSGYDSSKMIISGEQSGINAGTYNVTFTPRSGYQWWDETTEDKPAKWVINKAHGSITLSKESVTLDTSKNTDTVSVTRPGTGKISATSMETSIATAQVIGTEIIITGISTGNTAIIVEVDSDENYDKARNKEISVLVNTGKNLENCTPSEIQEAVQSGQAQNLWNVGDKVGIELNGTVGLLTFNKEVYYAFIIGFNHNSDIEGNNTIHFQFGKTSNGTDIAFCDDEYDQQGYSNGFRMEINNNNQGGWEGSNIRKNICPQFLSIMPEEWKKVIKACTKYTDNVGGGKDNSENVTQTQDKIWLLSSYEITESTFGGNSSEKNYQKQYSYYKNGNPYIKTDHKEVGTYCAWWLRTVATSNETSFRAILSIGFESDSVSSTSYGFSPGFMVA